MDKKILIITILIISLLLALGCTNLGTNVTCPSGEIVTDLLYCNDTNTNQENTNQENTINKKDTIYADINYLTECQILSEPGHYVLLNDIEINSTNDMIKVDNKWGCLFIKADDIIIDGYDHKISLKNSKDLGYYAVFSVYWARKNITIKNLNIEKLSGIMIRSNANLSILNNKIIGTELDAYGRYPTAIGIDIASGPNVLIKGNTIKNIVYSINLHGCDNYTIQDNNIDSVSRGINISGNQGGIIENNRVTNSTQNPGIKVGQGQTIDEQTIVNNNYVCNNKEYDIQCNQKVSPTQFEPIGSGNTCDIKSSYCTGISACIPCEEAEVEIIPTNPPTSISTCKGLTTIKYNLDGNYILINDINCSDSIMWSSGAGFGPIGTTDTPFTGTLNGQGYKIQNLSINRPTENGIGLFSKTNNSIIENINLVDVNIIGANIVGGLIAEQTSGTTRNTSVTGSVVGEQQVGGLIGFLDTGTIKNNYTKGLTLGTLDVGGLIGKTNDAMIIGNYTVSKVKGLGNGLIGTDNNSSITNNYWDVTLTGKKNCYNGINTGCKYTNKEETRYFGATGIPFSELDFGENWQAQINSHPVLKTNFYK